MITAISCWRCVPPARLLLCARPNGAAIFSLLQELKLQEVEFEKQVEVKALKAAEERAKRVEAWGVKTTVKADPSMAAAAEKKEKTKKVAASLFGAKKKKKSKAT